jgi:hypothetical protein
MKSKAVFFWLFSNSKMYSIKTKSIKFTLTLFGDAMGGSKGGEEPKLNLGLGRRYALVGNP